MKNGLYPPHPPHPRGPGIRSLIGLSGRLALLTCPWRPRAKEPKYRRSQRG
jgi:hypothetical protein